MNWTILCRLREFLKQFNMPFVIQGDWSMPPEVLRGSNWVDGLNAVILAPSLPTCSSPSGGIVLDYFVVHHSLQHNRQLHLLSSIATEPRKPAALTLQSSTDNPLIQLVKVPRRLPYVRPAGCDSRPWAFLWSQLAEAVPKLTDSTHASWVHFINLAEQHFLDMCQIPPSDQDKYVGRSRRLRLEQARTRVSQRLPFPRLSGPAMWWRRVACAFHALAQWHISLFRRRALSACRRLLREASTPPLVHQLERMHIWLHALDQASDTPPELARALEKAARVRAEREHKHAASAKSAQWRQRVRDNSRDGAAALFARAKPRAPWHATPLFQPDGTVLSAPASPQQEVDLLAEEWRKWWKVGASHALIEWPPGLGPLFPEPTAGEMRKVLRSFSARSGRGFDGVTPRQFEHLPDEALFVLFRLVMSIEAQCAWPELRSKVVFLLKRTGGRRPIGLLHRVARIQGRLRRPLLRAWQERYFRSFWWATAGRGSDKLAWIQSAMSEWAVSRGIASAAVLLDPEKAFEQISHPRLLSAESLRRRPWLRHCDSPFSSW